MAQSNVEFEDVDESGVSQIHLLRPTKQAYEQLLPELMAMPDHDLIVVNIDVTAAITTVTGALPEILAMRAAIEAEWRNFNFAQFDKLELYTLALTHAHARYRVATAPKGNIVELSKELNTIREQLLLNVLALASLGLVDRQRVSGVKQVPGYRPLAMDVLGLCEVLEDQWEEIEGKTAYTKDDLNRVGILAQQLLSAVGLREQSPAQETEVIAIRQKAFTLFMRAYENARRAVAYLRSDQADAIAPSLYLGRVPRRGEKENAAGDEAATETPASPGSGAASPATHSPATTAPPIVIDNRAGFPIDNPLPH